MADLSAVLTVEQLAVYSAVLMVDLLDKSDEMWVVPRVVLKVLKLADS